MRKILYSLFITLIFSCASENQKTGLEKIAAHYDAEVSHTKSLNKTKDESYSAFNIIVKNSKMLDSLSSGQTSTNIASLFFGSLTPDEQKECEVITVEVVNSETGKADKFKYNGLSLTSCWDQSKIFHAFSQNLLDKDYDGIADNLLKEYYTPILAQNIEAFMKNIEDGHGRLKSYKLTGIGILTADDKTRHYQYSGFLEFKDGYKRPYIVNTSVNKEFDEITGYLLEEGVRL